MKTIKLSRNQKVLVDNSDYKELGKYTWHCTSHGYAATNRGGRKQHRILYMHRLILNPGKGFYADHINGNQLDNRRENLRIVTPYQSRLNTKSKSKQGLPKGVSLHKNRKTPYSVSINRTFIGYFNTAHHAGLVYQLWAKDLYGKYAR